MKKLLSTQNKIFWLPKDFDATVETYLSDELPPLELCPSSYALVFKDGALLQTDLREGERPTRVLDIPGGHIDAGENPEQSVVRETFEETGLRVQMPKLVAYKKITIHSPRPEGYRCPHPVSYMLYYLCKVSEETPFEGNEDTHGRVWLEPEDYEKSPWYLNDKILVDEIVREYRTEVFDRTPLKEGRSESLDMCKQYLGKKVSLVIDQAYGTYHKGALYTENYGYIPGTLAPDGCELDAYFVGPKEPLEKGEGVVIAIIHRLDDDDDKLIVVPEGVSMTDAEIDVAVDFREKFFKHEVIR